VRLLLKEALKLLRPAIPAMIAIEQHVDNPCRNVLADPSHIHQIILNLCTNAFHAMEAAGGTLTLELREVAAADCPVCCKPDIEYLMLRVTDTGTGMDQATMNRIFEPFFTTKPVNKGTGLGLSVVYGIVQSCKGEITVASAEGTGSTFKIFLPVIDADADESPDAGSPPVMGKGRVLFVDDEPANLELMLVMLSKLGYIIATETSPVKAFDLFSRAPESFDLVITDLAMPGMTGLELAEKIHLKNPGLPVILMTGYGRDIDDTAALERCGIRQILKKPVKLHTLASSIHETINLTRR
ncbi:MAG: ATP-binding protein, partial [Lentisphaerota bacterium]